MIPEKDLQIDIIRAPHLNTGMYTNGPEDTAIRVTHLPTGRFVQVGSEKSQLQNKRLALVGLEAILSE